MTDAVGPQQRIGGYTLLDRLSHGPYGERWVGEASGVGRVAISLLLPELTADDAARTLFQQEMASAQRLQHPNVLRLIESGVDRGRPFIVSEMLAGETLDLLLGRETNGALAESVVARIARDVCRGLIYAHAAEPPEDEPLLLHRDLSPRNLFITAEGTAKIANFGVGSAVQRLAQLRALGLRGSADYFSPEQIRGAKLDVRSDLFALGAVLFEALTGEPPFEGEALADRGTRPLAFRGHNNGHDGLQAIITRALQADPGRRFSSAKEMSEELEQLIMANTDDLRKIMKEPAKPKEKSSIQLFSFDVSAFASKPGPAASPKQEETTKEIIAALETSWNDLSDISESGSGPIPMLEDLAAPPIVGLHKQALAAQSPVDQKLTSRELAIIGSILAVLSLSFALGYLFLGRSLRQLASPHARELSGTVGGLGDLPELEMAGPETTLWRPTQLALSAPLAPIVKPSTITSSASTLASRVEVIVRLGDRVVPCEVTVDGRPAGSAPLEISLLPGRHTIRVRPAGAAAMEREVQVRAGEEERVVFDLDK